MKDAKIIFQAKNLCGDILGERHFNVAFKTFDDIADFIQSEISHTRKLGRKRFPDVDFFVDYIFRNDLPEGEEPNVYLSYQESV